MQQHTYSAVARMALAAPSTPPSGLPEGHLRVINALQARRGKPALEADGLIARPIRLTGNQLTDYDTRFPDMELQRFADQINAGGAALLSGHVTDDTPLGSFYFASVTAGEDGTRWLDTWAYWLSDEDGIKLARDIDAGIVNESSIGFDCERLVCSITGGDYFASPYLAGREYDITDPATNTTTRRLCFIWTVGCSINEGSVCYKGAHPNTRVGGTIPGFTDAPPPSALHAPTPHRFSLSVNSDMLTGLQKARVNPVSSPPAAPNPPETGGTAERQEGEPMNLHALTVALGLAASATETDITTRASALQAAHRELLQFTGATTTEGALGTIAAWQADVRALETTRAELQALQTAGLETRMTALRDQGYSAARWTPAEWDSLFQHQSPERLEAFLASSTRVVTGGEEPPVEPAGSTAGAQGAMTQLQQKAAALQVGGKTPLQALEQAMRENPALAVAARQN
jgi:hypothetical protein